jgi:hypothetical protein
VAYFLFLLLGFVAGPARFSCWREFDLIARSRPAFGCARHSERKRYMSIRQLMRRSIALVLGVLAVGALASASVAQALDTPTLQVDRVGFFRIDLDVHAGASGAPNGFVVQWMKKSTYDVVGWPSDEYDPNAAYCDFTGGPTLNTDVRSSTFQLGPNGAIQVQIGDLFDETGVYGSYLDQIPPGEYVFRVWAEGTGAPGTESAKSEALTASTTNPECTQGFWKNHPETWPASCTPMLLGTVSYTQTQLLAIYNEPANGNGLIALAHQLITAKLNICNGSSATNIAATVAASDALIGGLVIPPVGAGFLSPASTSALTNTLDDWNNGIIPGVVDCVTPTTPSTWGHVKSMYH